MIKDVFEILLESSRGRDLARVHADPARDRGLQALRNRGEELEDRQRELDAALRVVVARVGAPDQHLKCRDGVKCRD